MNRPLPVVAYLLFLGVCANAFPDSPSASPAGRLPKALPCSRPVKVEGEFNPRLPNLLITFKDGIDPTAAAERLARKYRFKIGAIWTALGGFFIRNIDVKIVPLLQCEPTINLMSFDVESHPSA
jgi:hypothetical protein